MAATREVIQSTTPSRVIDFEEVARALRTTGKKISRFAVGVTHGYFPSFHEPNSQETSILYQVVIDVGNYTSLVIRAHELQYSSWGIRATLHYAEDELLCAVWKFANGIAPRCAIGVPYCAKCLAKNCNDTCHADIDVSQVAIKALPNQLVRWVRKNLPREGFRSQQHKTEMLAAA